MTRPSRRAVVLAGALAGATAWAAPAGARHSNLRHERPLTELERTDAERLLVVVTKEVPLDPVDYAPSDLVPWRDTAYELRAEVNDQLEELFSAAEAEGLGLRVISGYRSYETQAGTYDYWVRNYGQASADATSARPGHSEHQTGLAVDLDDLTGGCYLDACFGELPEGRWVARHAHRFGFVLSYPQGLRDRTGYTYEPWHLRYVGPHAARAMRELGVPLLQDYRSPRVAAAGLGSLLGRRD
ncbi:M15 family metallopeptidase [Ornithinimicrobium sediminis]|uniref:M15 family metallopeptidase n=1 Tax=Ornithinimicrobium sediminis TaxID=2904603 RepID=UPI001E42AADC|nr:M15 family metallopeptidase [Ornithinimicrobium sediminis]